MWHSTGLGIRRLPFALLAVMTFTACILAGLVLYQAQLGKHLQQYRTQHADKLFLASTLISREMGELQEITRLIYQDQRLHSALTSGQPINKRLIEEVFRQYGASIDNLLQLRWLDHSGQEVVRADIGTDTGVSFTAPQHLQNKQDRYYFQEAFKLTNQQIYLSPIDLNVEGGRYVEPIQPTIRTAVRTGEPLQMRAGVLVINYDLNKLLSKIMAFNDKTTYLKILDAQGQWLMHPDPDKTWALSLNRQLKAVSTSQAQLWQAIRTFNSGELKQKNGAFTSYRTVNLADNGVKDATSALTIIAETSPEILGSELLSALINAGALSGILLVLSSLLLYREHHARLRITNMGRMLENENHQLLAMNDELDTALQRQQKLQDDLVETRKLSALGMTVAGVAHELNTPLGGALLITSEQRNCLAKLNDAVNTGLTRSALDEYLNDSQHNLEMIEANLTSARRQIEGFKRLAYERMDEAIVDFEIHTVVEDLLHTLTPQLKKHSVSVENQIPPHIYMHNTPGILSQVIQNLIVNALRHGFQGFNGGKITLSTHMLTNNRMQLIVSDDGRGIPATLVPTLFDPFVTSARSSNHTGLGLHLVFRWVTEELGGKVYFEHNSPHGARFVLELDVTDTRKDREAESFKTQGRKSIFQKV